MITYMTGGRRNLTGFMGLEVIPQLCEQLEKIPSTEKNIDLLIVSQGGDPNVAWRIISLLRERFEKVGVLIPFNAQSAATLLAFGADEIIMHPFSSLGPIDAQIAIRDQYGMPTNIFSDEDVRSFISFVEDDLKIDTLEAGTIVLEQLCKELSPTKIGLTKKSMNFTEALATKLLLMRGDNNPDEVSKIIGEFKNFSNHGYTVNKSEAKKLNLPIKDASDVEEIMWEIWRDAEGDMRVNELFDPMMTIATDKEIMDKFKKAASTKKPVMEIQTITVPLSYLESVRKFNSFNVVMAFNIVMDINLNIKCDIISTVDKWESTTD